MAASPPPTPSAPAVHAMASQAGNAAVQQEVQALCQQAAWMLLLSAGQNEFTIYVTPPGVIPQVPMHLSPHHMHSRRLTSLQTRYPRKLISTQAEAYLLALPNICCVCSCCGGLIGYDKDMCANMLQPMLLLLHAGPVACTRQAITASCHPFIITSHLCRPQSASPCSFSRGSTPHHLRSSPSSPCLSELQSQDESQGRCWRLGLSDTFSRPQHFKT